MTDIYIVDAYKCLKNFVSLLESNKPTYQIGFKTGDEIHTYPAKFQKTDSGDFELSFEAKELYHTDLFYCFPITISSEWYNISFSNLEIPSVNSTFSNNSSNPKAYRILTKSFTTGMEETWKDAIICAYCTYNHNDFNPDNCGILHSGRSKDSIRYFKIHIDGLDIFVFFGLKDDDNRNDLKDERYLSFVTSQPIKDFSTFRRMIDVIRVAWGLISGYFIGESIYYTSVKQGVNTNGPAFRYQNMQECLNSKRPIIDTSLYNDLPSEALCLTCDEFSSLVEILYQNVNCYRAAQLLIQASNDKDLSKGGLAAIALETITGTFLNKDVMKPVKEKYKLPAKLIQAIKKSIQDFEEPISEELKIKLDRSIDNLSAIPNAEKLIIPFQELGITLSETEEVIIDCRNQFLHGVLPEKARKKVPFAALLSDEDLIFYTSNKLIMLCSMLLLRMAKIDKSVIDWGVYLLVIKNLMTKGKSVSQFGKKHRNPTDSVPQEDSPLWLEL